MSSWIDIANINDIPKRGARIVKTHLGCIAVFRTQDDQVFAIDDACPHKQGSLSDGMVHGRAVTCPLHNWVIDLESGQALGAEEGRVATYETRVKNNRVFLDTSLLLQKAVA